MCNASEVILPSGIDCPQVVVPPPPMKFVIIPDLTASRSTRALPSATGLERVSGSKETANRKHLEKNILSRFLDNGGLQGLEGDDIATREGKRRAFIF